MLASSMCDRPVAQLSAVIVRVREPLSVYATVGSPASVNNALLGVTLFPGMVGPFTFSTRQVVIAVGLDAWVIV